MEIKPFKDLKVTTMTLIARFSGKIEINPIFCLLPITRMDLPEKKRNTKKIKIPHCAIPGSILSLRFAGCTRGIFRTSSRRHFRNSITMDISTTEKNISLKLSESSIQMCGPTSMAMGQEAIYHLFKHIRTIQEHVEYMNKHRTATQRALEWVIEKTRGPPKLRVDRDVVPCKNVTLAVTESSSDYDVVLPSEEAIGDSEADEKIIRFLLQQCPDFANHSQLCDDFTHITSLEKVLDGDLECEHIYKAMVNYNYHLGFRVERQILKNVFDRAPKGWCARYDPRLDHTVTIQIPYEVPPELQFMRKTDKVHCHTFMVQKSGVVTQSGPDQKMMEEAYLDFMHIIYSHKEAICAEIENANENASTTEKEKSVCGVERNDLLVQQNKIKCS